jgi:integrase
MPVGSDEVNTMRARLEPGGRYRTADGKLHQTLRIAVLWKSPCDLRPRRYRFPTGAEYTRAHRRLWEKRLKEIRELAAEQFDPISVFPLSRGAVGTTILTRQQTLTVGEAARRHLEELAGDAKINTHTRNQYHHIFQVHVLDSDLAKVPLAQLSDGHIKLWLAQLQRKTSRNGKRLEASTINKVLARLRTFITLAWKRGEIPRPINPMELVDNLPKSDVDKISPFTPDELLAILSVCGGQQRALYTLLAFTGMRPSEALGLWWEHIDLKGDRILVRQQVREDGSVDSKLKTRRSRRDIEMFEPVRASLAGLAAQNRLRSKFVFCGRLGRPLRERTQGDDPWREALARGEVEYRRLYTLRHTYTSLMLAAGRNAQWVAYQLGHVDTKKLHEVYERWMAAPAAERLDLEALFVAVRELPPRAAKILRILPTSCPRAKLRSGSI